MECLADKKITLEEADDIAPLVSTEEKSAAQTVQDLVKVNGIFYPVCPHEEALRGPLLTYTDACMKNFITQVIVWIQKSQCKDRTYQTSAKEIVGFEKTSKELVSEFSAACVCRINTKMERTKILYFYLLGCSALRGSRGKRTDKVFEHLRQNQIEKAFEKLLKFRFDSEQDSSFRRLGKFYELYLESVNSGHETSQENERETIDHMFTSEKDCLVYKKVLK